MGHRGEGGWFVERSEKVVWLVTCDLRLGDSGVFVAVLSRAGSIQGTV